jgi:hypothetical protein
VTRVLGAVLSMVLSKDYLHAAVGKASSRNYMLARDYWKSIAVLTHPQFQRRHRTLNGTLRIFICMYTPTGFSSRFVNPVREKLDVEISIVAKQMISSRINSVPLVLFYYKLDFQQPTA